VEIKPKDFFVIEGEEVEATDYKFFVGNEEPTELTIGRFPRFRFFSLYILRSGPWCSTIEEAEIQGREHTRIIKMLHGGEK
jgi:hypothetical protein